MLYVKLLSSPADFDIYCTTINKGNNITGLAMDFDDEFDEEYDDALEYEDSDYNPPKSGDMADKAEAGEGLNPMDITDPASALFLLSDDAQDEISGTDKTKIRCLTCGHKFLGDIYDDCPECFSPNTEEAVEETNDGY
jgi:hypothetical protein